MVTWPCSSNCCTCCTIRNCTSSTSLSRIGPCKSISSVIKVRTRSDILIAQHFVLHFVGGALQRDDQILLVDLWILCVHIVEDVFLDRGVGQVEDVGHDLGTAHVLVAAEHVAQARLEAFLDFLEDIGGDIFHRGDAVGHVRLQPFGRLAENAGGLVGFELREDQRDRLGVLVVDKGRDLVAGHVAQHLEARRDLRRDVVEDFLRLPGPDGALEGLAGEVDAAPVDPLAGQ